MSVQDSFWMKIPDKGVKIEVFIGHPPCYSCLKTLKTVSELGMEHLDKLHILVYVGKSGEELFKEYGLSCVPSVVVDEVIKISGIAPPEDLLVEAVKKIAGVG
ncbi:MAG: thioredoxin family protein [Candidatus Bathyarchaeia archaeon]